MVTYLERTETNLYGQLVIKITVTDEVKNKVKTKNIRLAGKDFSHEQGGDHNASFLFIYTDPDERFGIHVLFSIDNKQIYNWLISVVENLIHVEVIEDELNVPDKFLNWDPDYDA